jgi:hypothetical protein
MSWPRHLEAIWYRYTFGRPVAVMLVTVGHCVAPLILIVSNPMVEPFQPATDSP